mmetsp:Transcript_12626/g.9158  ORF Transcript_12626/g.9158 Transcript_12626/m.9158 type:complete len:169 (+) Transcript_12626:333-839(+)
MPPGGMGGLGGLPPGMMGMPGMGGMPGGMNFDPGMMQAMMNNPMVQSMLADPQVIQGFLQSNPFMSQMVNSNPELQAMLNNPEAMRQMMSPESLQAAMAMFGGMQDEGDGYEYGVEYPNKEAEPEKSLEELREMYKEKYQELKEMEYDKTFSEEVLLRLLHKNGGDVS